MEQRIADFELDTKEVRARMLVLKKHATKSSHPSAARSGTGTVRLTATDDGEVTFDAFGAGLWWSTTFETAEVFVPGTLLGATYEIDECAKNLRHEGGTLRFTARKIEADEDETSHNVWIRHEGLGYEKRCRWTLQRADQIWSDPEAPIDEHGVCRLNCEWGDVGNIAAKSKKITYAISTNNARENLTGAYVTSDHDGLGDVDAPTLLCATDGHRLAAIGLPKIPNVNDIVPTALWDLVEYAASKDVTNCESAEVGVGVDPKGERWFLVKMGRWAFGAKPINGTYPPVSETLPSTDMLENNRTYYLRREDACRAARIMKGETSPKTRDVVLDFTNGTLCAADPDVGETRIDMPLVNAPDAEDGKKLSLNITYLIETLKRCDNGIVKVTPTGKTSPMMLYDQNLNGDKTLHIIMPMRL